MKGPIDLLHQGAERVIGTYVLETEDGLALVDCGPTTCLAELERSVPLGEVRHILLTHIHLDHAGAAGVIVDRHPHVHVHVSAVGAPHLVDPTRLEASARRLYGDSFDPLWGELRPVPAANVRVVGDRVLGLECFPAPGHASHQVAYLDGEGTLYPGDAAGVRILPGRSVLPVSPPHDIDGEAWTETITEMERRAPARLALPHFGVFDDPADHLARLREALATWTQRAAELTEPEWIEAARDDVEALDGDLAERYELAAPLWQSWQGLERYWRKKREREAVR